jgi:lipopolysaccharide export system protein LptC
MPTWLKEEEQAPDVGQQDAYQPTYKAINLRSALYDENGELTHRIFASEMEHYEQLGFVFFRQPQYTLYTSDSEQPWRLTADEGTLYDDNRIQLEQNVVIQSLSDTSFVKTITTDFIQINLDTKLMTSDQAVIIVGEEYQVQSNGFDGNLNTKQYELKQHVKTVYSPTTETQTNE